MAEISIAGIMRAGAYSPNHIGNDAAIFNIVADQLRKRGYIVNVYNEDTFVKNGVTEPVIVDMCREKESINLLQQLEDQGRLVINSGYGIENCTRERMTRILVGSGIPYPKSLMVNTDEAIIEKMKEAGIERAWIKRGDFHAMHKEDVSYVRHPAEAQEVLQEYFLRGIPRAVINIHLEGDLIKFYGVRNTDFFYWFYPLEVGHSKYGHEAINGPSRGITFDEAYLREICAQAATELDVVVYGGDAIIDPDGTIRIIDFNDWPSFAPCRDQAGPYIARAIMTMIKNHVK